MDGTPQPSTHPPLPPTTEEDRLAWLRLLRSRRVGPSTFYRLMAEHGSAQAALEALPGLAASAGVPSYRPCPEGIAREELRRATGARARMLTPGDALFPRRLMDLDEPPPLLWMVGEPRVLSRPMIALVGARNASSLATRMAERLATDLAAAGYVIVSGLARGVDTAAHRASLATGTVAVLAGGADIPYPAENADLADRLLLNGARVSERPLGHVAQARDFPRRNRLISGMAEVVVVVEAAAKSGSLITARNALDQGREAMAVPGHPFDARAAGCNLLLRDGARLVRSAEDVLEALPPLPAAQRDLALAPPDTRPTALDRARDMALALTRGTPVTRAARDLRPPAPAAAETDSPPEDTPLIEEPPESPAPAAAAALAQARLHEAILARLSCAPLQEDQLIRDLDAPAAQIAPALLDLELSERIERRPGGMLTLVPDPPGG
ncbi:DNA-processing protein DprA [Maritimibacter alkaliphilus]|uniref:DNA-processing protein DprA n=1 Tax=Maritimibacter alkaliphilus TaxID=404236 RepID=UPI001C975FF9|nr:DNA-processing protein DprA [Maritimibacter alkaliphilus]MBY6089052.1 DNA-processing protein DprA [Maritimibacter alkaliphilus]